MINISVNNETSQLQLVVVGIADDFGGVPDVEDCYDPKSRMHVINGTFPTQDDLCNEMEGFISVLKKYNVDILRPSNIKGLNQIFARDISFVIDDKIIIPNILKKRQKELEAISTILSNIPQENKIVVPKNVNIEGGDVILSGEYIFVGFSQINDFNKYTVSRTNEKGLNFLRDIFTNKNVVGFELNKSDVNPRNNALHLDCCFQPIGRGTAILYPGGFKNIKDVEFIKSYFHKDNIIEIDREEMYNMNSNIFSISDDVLVSEKSFIRLNTELRRRGFTVEEVNFFQTGKMEGLLRCSTMPLNRR